MILELLKPISLSVYLSVCMRIRICLYIYIYVYIYIYIVYIHINIYTYYVSYGQSWLAKRTCDMDPI